MLTASLPAAAPAPPPPPLQDQIKAHITDLMLSAPPRVRAQLSEALAIVSGHDFPARWPQLLPHLVEKLAATDPQTLHGVLGTADSIYQRYRCGGGAGRRAPGQLLRL